MREIHNIPPVYNESCRVLILGSFPSVKSRETEFFYGHPQNRFWRVLAAVFGCAVPVTVEEKKTLLLSNGIALWDVLAECDISGSSDVSIRKETPNDLSVIVSSAPISRIYLNGKTAEKYYKKYNGGIKIPAVTLPSTSPANAAKSLDDLVSEWNIIKNPVV